MATSVTVPATGATTIDDEGVTANPSPRIFDANVSSATSVIGLIAPSTGATTVSPAGVGVAAGFGDAAGLTGVAGLAVGAAATLLGPHHLR
ncbi:hypothetical protein [Bifidobacterium samirii]|uniref:hypothetical protein n=1 Tax=Bifidobacterium samirii TaxID=2306974 RepID=UPI001F495DF0|nr:hypothetical protein [Bifidobacterium samirii]